MVDKSVVDSKEVPPEMDVMTLEEEEGWCQPPKPEKQPAKVQALSWDEYLLMCPRSRSRARDNLS